MTGRQSYSIEELKDMLLARSGDVIHRYAPAAKGSYTDAQGRYFTLNPGRADRSVGSFWIHTAGPREGRWCDMATGQHGDILDLIALHLGCSLTDAIREARGLLGLQNDSPEARRLRERAAAEARRRREEAAREDRRRRADRSRRAHALWLGGRERIAGTPVEFYLRDRRGIDLAPLGRQPRALRYVPQCFYRHVDDETGEVIEGRWPAMVALVHALDGRVLACHRTWLAIGPDGRWDKAPLPEPKKVLGDYAGGAIRLWAGTGPRGGKPGPLGQVAPGAQVYVAEGIEDALSAAMLLPEARILAGISLSNLGNVRLPPAVATVTLIADQDATAEARAALDKAVAAHRAAGRTVRVWKNRHGGKDLNDALRQARVTREQGAA